MMFRYGFLIMVLSLACACATTPTMCDLDSAWNLARTQHMIPAPFSAHRSPNCPSCPSSIRFYDRHGVSHVAFIGEYDTPYKGEYHTFVLVIRCAGNGRYERVALVNTVRERIDFLSFMPGKPDMVAVALTAESDDAFGITLTSPPCLEFFSSEDWNTPEPLCWSQGPDGEYDWLPKKQ